MPPISSLISWFQAVSRLISRWLASSGSSRATSSGTWVAMPQLHLPALAGTAQVAAHGQQSGGGDVAGVRPQGNGLHHIGGAADAAAHHDRHLVPDALVPQTLVHGSQRQLDGDAHVVPDAGGRRAGAAPEPVDGDDVRTAPGDAAGDGGDVVDGGHLDDDGLLIVGGFLQGVDQLPQVFDGVDVVMGRRGDGVRALRYHTGAGHVAHDLGARQMPADAGLCTLAHLDLNGRAGVQIVLDGRRTGRRPPGRWCSRRSSRNPRGDRPHRCCSRCPVRCAARARLCVGVVADGAVAHGGEHHRHGKLQLGRQGAVQGSVRAPGGCGRAACPERPWSP